ncbi:hypothetical protein [Streptomyces sp. R33]|uniref:Endoglucanase B carbohydrate binding domain-containing protein n=1 Tax=Streptomyces sp. R33 TaxID=3238629 RepID=A0AB39YEB3_9ACTN
MRRLPVHGRGRTPPRFTVGLPWNIDVVTNDGPTDWTPYQENKAFSPGYPNGTIILAPEFLNVLRDGEPATLVFHFYRGATVAYHVTKSGNSVTGTAS